MKIEGYLIQRREPGSAKPRWGWVGSEMLDKKHAMRSVHYLRQNLPNTEWRVMALCHAEDES